MTQYTVPDGLVCRFDGPQAWYDWMVVESAAGHFPATRLPTPEEATLDGKAPRCCYLTPEGRQCLIGGLFSPEDAERLEKACAGKSVTFGDSQVSGWGEALPPWLPRKDAYRIQSEYHDVEAGRAWVHARFVNRLNSDPFFVNCVHTQV